MALFKHYENSAGVSVEYWRIGNFQFSTTHKFVDIQILGYLCQQCRTDGKDYIEARKARVVFDMFAQYFSPEQMDTANQNVIKIAYNYIKENEPFFLDATDV